MKHERHFFDVCHFRCVYTHTLFIPTNDSLQYFYTLSKCFLNVILLTCKDEISPINFIIEYMATAI